MRIPSGLKSKEAAALALLVVAGVAYYGQYYDYGFNTGDEGALVLYTMRILDGERPYLDLGLGYGLLWYYPLALLFKITGASFIVARIYLLSLALLCSLLAYLTVRKQTRIMALAINVALLTLALPGDLQNVYIPLIVLANMLAVSHLDLDRRALPCRPVWVAGLVVGVSWFVRADLAFGAALVLAATLTAHTAFSHPPRRWLPRLARLLARAGGGALLPALPMVFVAYRQGFLEALFNHVQWPFRYLAYLPTLARTNKFVEIGADAPAQAGATLGRMPLSAVWEPESPARALAILTYLPLVSLALIVSIACLRMVRSRRRGHPAIGDDLGVLALAGLASTSFPQFFLFRPDAAHLSFFMPGFFVLAAVCLGRWVLPAPAAARDRPEAPDSGLRLPARLVLGGVVFFHLGLYFWFGIGAPTTGSAIALAHGRTDRFVGHNGVDVAVTPFERYVFDKVFRTVAAHSDEGDALLCFPFGPGWNVMTDRRTFLYSLYVDDSHLARGVQQEIIAGIEREQPPVIIVDNWAINGTEISRFKNWATQIMSHIHSEYLLLDRVGSLEIYGRREMR